MLNKKTDPRFRSFITQEYNKLENKASTNALVEKFMYIPKRKIAEQYKETAEYAETKERLFLLYGGKKFKDALCNDDCLLELAEDPAYDNGFAKYCRGHETKEEREDRLKKEEEERRRTEELKQKYAEFIKEYDIEPYESEIVCDIVTDCINGIEYFFENENLIIESYDYPYAYKGDYSRKWYNKKTKVADSIDEYLDYVFDLYSYELNEDIIEEATGEEYPFFLSSIMEKLLELDKTLKEYSELLDATDDIVDIVVDSNLEEKIHDQLKEHFTRDKVVDLLSKNKYATELIRKKETEEEEERYRIEREKNLQKSMLDHIPDNYIDFFPLARDVKRKFILHIGPTNSGKTHEAIAALTSHGGGIYLAPLRLLAYEQFEQLNESGFLCDLVTGEEKIIVEGACFQASTIEMADFSKLYEAAIIDEAQMISDPDRGGAWTTAILGLRCPEIHVCMAPSAEGIIIKLIEDCGDEYEIQRHERMTPLMFESSSINIEKDVKKGDALIVFSKKHVHAVAAELQRSGHKCSIIYGALPYDVRHEQAKLFADGKNEILVATDAIGMGLNLPIQRIIFLEQQKYDGKSMRPLKTEEIKQIAGRAGRYGIYDKGMVTSYGKSKMIRKALGTETESIQSAVVAFPESLIGLDEPLSKILRSWNKIEVKEGYEKADMGEMIKKCIHVEAFSEDKQFLYKCITIPFDIDKTDLFSLWSDMCKAEAIGDIYPVKNVSALRRSNFDNLSLDDLERAYKQCDLLYSYCDKFGRLTYIDKIMETKKEISRAIMKKLDKQKLKGKTCSRCGCPLPWYHNYGMCTSCYDNMVSARRGYGYWNDEYYY